MSPAKNDIIENATKSGKTEKIKVSEKTNAGNLAIVLVRSFAGMEEPLRQTLALLKLLRKNHCVIVKNNVIYKGMINKVKDYVTWGEVDDNTFKQLVEKRGEAYEGRLKDGTGSYNYNFLEFNGKKYKSYFRLNPPRKGFGRKGVKIAFKVGGALGYRGTKINDLILRML
jgi:large subunit ribosomal protein L30